MSAPSRSQILESWLSRGGKVAAVFPIHYSRALLRSCGFLPIEVWGPPGAGTFGAEAHLQTYACDIVRRGLDFLLSGGLERCHCLLVPHGCDALQGLGSVLMDFIQPKLPVVTFYPARRRDHLALEFCAAELHQLQQRLSALSGRTPNAEELQRAIEAEQQADELLERLMRERSRLDFSNLDFYRLCRYRGYLPAEDFCALAQEALSRRREEKAGPKVVLSGIVPEPMEILSALDELGVEIAADDTCLLGRRLYPPAADADPWRREARRLLSGPPDSTRGDSLQQRGEHLVSLARNSGARAVIFLQPPFCEPELFYLPQLRRRLEENGINSLALEHEIVPQFSAGARTRLEAFLETL